MFQNSYFYTKLENKTLGLPPPRALLLGNGNYCSVTQNTKISIFSVVDGVFSLSHYRRKPYSEKNLTDEEILFNYRLSSKRCVTENAFRIWINRFRIFARRASLIPNVALFLSIAIPALRNLLSLKSRDLLQKVHLIKFRPMDCSYKINGMKLFRQAT